MSLGANRDYKTTDRRARRNLQKHSAIMEYLITHRGVPRDEASRQALKAIEEGFDVDLLAEIDRRAAQGRTE